MKHYWKVSKVIALLGVLAMSMVLIYGFTKGNFIVNGSEILANPWGIVSMVDLYVGFTLFSMWIIYREKNVLSAIIWVTLMMVLGFFAGSLYVLLALISSKGDAKKFFGFHDEL